MAALPGTLIAGPVPTPRSEEIKRVCPSVNRRDRIVNTIKSAVRHTRSTCGFLIENKAPEAPEAHVVEIELTRFGFLRIYEDGLRGPMMVAAVQRIKRDNLTTDGHVYYDFYITCDHLHETETEWGKNLRPDDYFSDGSESMIGLSSVDIGKVLDNFKVLNGVTVHIEGCDYVREILEKAWAAGRRWTKAVTDWHSDLPTSTSTAETPETPDSS